MLAAIHYIQVLMLVQWFPLAVSSRVQSHMLQNRYYLLRALKFALQYFIEYHVKKTSVQVQYSLC